MERYLHSPNTPSRRGVQLRKKEAQGQLYVSEIRWEGVDWRNVTRDRDHWRAFVNTVMSLWVP
jgi:hypothetical protein